jgi:hypothetical protein
MAWTREQEDEFNELVRSGHMIDDNLAREAWGRKSRTERLHERFYAIVEENTGEDWNPPLFAVQAREAQVSEFVSALDHIYPEDF